ncbi:MAG TPA: right-handed parallel beta-helix repeat-containing protein [Terriglobia bacterium]|nr:right-handed parallel beta-helix repeat-containing protein [Terriglobia bacterium]
MLLKDLWESGLPPVSITQSHVTIMFVNCHLSYGGNGITITGADDALIGDDNTSLTAGGVAVTVNSATSGLIEHLRVVQSGYSAFMVKGTATGIRFVDDSATRYNTLNQTGHAGFFIYGPTTHILFDHCSATNGNGMGFRMDTPSGLPEHVRVVNCNVERTSGHSAEGIGPLGVDIWVVNCRVYKSGATGILVFNGRSGTEFRNIFIIGNSIGDSSQEITGNAAIQIDPTSNRIQGVVVSNNIAWDDQSSPTSQVMLSLTNLGQGGAIDSLSVTGNLSIRQKSSAGVSNSMPAGKLTNSSLGVASAL